MSEQPSQSVTLTKADLAAIVETAATAAVTAALKAMPAAPTQAPVDVERLGEVISEGINAAAPARQVSIGEYLRRQTPKATLKNRTYIENGRRIDEHLMRETPDDTSFIDLINAVTRSGVYFDDDVTVDYIVHAGGHVDVSIKWFSGDNDRRRDIERKFGPDGVKDAWRVIVAEQAKLDREEEDARKETQNRRSFGAQRDIQKAAYAARQAAAEAHV